MPLMNEKVDLQPMAVIAMARALPEQRRTVGGQSQDAARALKK